MCLKLLIHGCPFFLTERSGRIVSSAGPDSAAIILTATLRIYPVELSGKALGLSACAAASEPIGHLLFSTWENDGYKMHCATGVVALVPLSSVPFALLASRKKFSVSAWEKSAKSAVVPRCRRIVCSTLRQFQHLKERPCCRPWALP